MRNEEYRGARRRWCLSGPATWLLVMLAVSLPMGGAMSRVTAEGKPVVLLADDFGGLRAGLFSSVVEAHAEYLGRARYDDLLEIATTASFAGKARLRFDVAIAHAGGGPGVARGYTVHAITDRAGKPIRPPAWLTEKVHAARAQL